MQNLFDLQRWTRSDYYRLFQLAEDLSREPQPLGGMAAMVFAEPSTRTLVSFQMAAVRMGMTTTTLDALGSSLSKGESMDDTLRTLQAIGVQAAVIRSSSDWPAQLETAFPKMALINAGSGVFDHPTQALLDGLTMYQEFSHLSGCRVVIAGDVRHSRVARSNAQMLAALGAEVTVSGPIQWAGETAQGFAPWVPWDEAVRKNDVEMMLRVQRERHEDSTEFADNYLEQWGMTQARADAMVPGAIIMHPGPVNRGVEIADSVMDHSRSRILKQVENGVLARMAVLSECMKGGRREQLVSA